MTIHFNLNLFRDIDIFVARIKIKIYGKPPFVARKPEFFRLEKLANNKYEDVRLAVAKNPNTPKYLQKKIANKKY